MLFLARRSYDPSSYYVESSCSNLSGGCADRAMAMAGDTRWATPGDPESTQQFAKELVALQPDLNLSHTTPTTASLLQQTRAIPIIFAVVADPVGSGLVASFPQPSGNVTGFTIMEPPLPGKWLELLKEIAPRVNRVAFHVLPSSRGLP
jgi:putative tryptophan/tyrosine transport system substrate-binding protein